jgi:hypothetical protein
VDVLRRKWEQRQVPGTLESGGEHALVTGAGAGLSARLDLATVRDITAKAARLLVVDVGHFVDAECTDPAAAEAATTASAARAFVALGARALSVCGLLLTGLFDYCFTHQVLPILRRPLLKG